MLGGELRQLSKATLSLKRQYASRDDSRGCVTSRWGLAAQSAPSLQGGEFDSLVRSVRSSLLDGESLKSISKQFDFSQTGCLSDDTGMGTFS